MSGRIIARLMVGAAFAVAGVAFGAPGAIAAQRKELPAGPNRELVPNSASPATIWTMSLKPPAPRVTRGTARSSRW
jgi:hypothetical protein